MHAKHAEDILPGILETISDTRLRGRLPIVVFDLDDTLFSRANRHISILRDFAHNAKATALIKEAANRLAAEGESGITNWSLDEAARNAGVDVHDLKKAMHEYCLEKALHNEHAAEDGAVPGAPEFIQNLLGMRGVVAFLTRRDESQREATLKSLQRHGFPLPGEMPWRDRVQLIMKPKDDSPDIDFKLATVDALGRTGDVIACFEHDPAYLEKFLEHFPETAAVLVNLHHSSKHPVRDPRIIAVEDLQPKKTP